MKEDKAGKITWVKEKRRSGSYLFPRTAMQQIYKAYFLKRLRRMVGQGRVKVRDKPAMEYLLHEVGFKRWNVYLPAGKGRCQTSLWRTKAGDGIPR